jgi:hypothetical protein
MDEESHGLAAFGGIIPIEPSQEHLGLHQSVHSALCFVQFPIREDHFGGHSARIVI